MNNNFRSSSTDLSDLLRECWVLVLQWFWELDLAAQAHVFVGYRLRLMTTGRQSKVDKPQHTLRIGRYSERLCTARKSMAI